MEMPTCQHIQEMRWMVQTVDGDSVVGSVLINMLG